LSFLFLVLVLLVIYLLHVFQLNAHYVTHSEAKQINQMCKIIKRRRRRGGGRRRKGNDGKERAALGLMWTYVCTRTDTAQTQHDPYFLQAVHCFFCSFTTGGLNPHLNQLLSSPSSSSSTFFVRSVLCQLIDASK